MILHFTRQLVTDYRAGIFEHGAGNLYCVSANDKKVAEMLIKSDISYLEIANNTFFIKDNTIFSGNGNGKTGHFKLAACTIFIGYADKLIAGSKRYVFKRIKTGTRWSLFSQKCRGQFKFRLSGTMEYVNYSFKIYVPVLSIGNPFIHQEFSGKIELNEADIIPGILALFLIDRALKLDAI